MNNISNIEEKMQHIVSETICIKCGARKITVRPSTLLLKDMVCTCGERGGIIETGQDISGIKK